jgi:hypothetical protein
MYTTVECLQGAFLSMHITDGFARAGIWPYNPAVPLNSSLVRYTNDMINFSPPPKRKRGCKIAGKVLTTGEPTPLAITNKPPTPTPPPQVTTLPPTPAAPARQNTPICVTIF